MKSFLPPAALFCAFTVAVNAFGGTDHSLSRELAVSPASAGKDDWQFTVGLPGWLAGVKGDVGVGGLNPVHVDVPFSNLLPHIDMVAALSAEAQHGPWSFFAAGMYLKLGVEGDPPGRLLNSINVSLREVVAEVGVAYRLCEGKRGYFDLIAGARYLYMGVDMNFDVSSSGVDAIGRDVADVVVGRVTGAVQRAVSEIAPELKSAAAGKITSGVAANIRGKVGQILQQYPRLPGVIGGISNGSGPVSDAVRELIAAKVAEKQAALTGAVAAASSEVAAAKARAKSKLQSDVRRAEQNLANQISTAIKKAIPAEASGSKSWVDPFVGFRARYNVTDSLYATARADIGGFGIGSKLAWEAYGALGWQFNRHWSTELGYRYLSEDYESGGFVFDAAMGGAYLGLNYKF